MDMNYYAVDSEIIEILNTLRPPVKREGRNTQPEYLSYVIGGPDNVNFVRDYSQVYKAELKKTSNQRRAVKSSLSLVLKKTDKRQILEKYLLNRDDSVVKNIETAKGQAVQDYTETVGANGKPLIKVTVIPKTDHQAVVNFLEARSQINSGDKKSLIDKNSINTKNVYLIVAGSKKEKIYEIKTTGTDKALKYNIKNVKDLFNKRNKKSCDMEKKKKKSSVQDEEEPELASVACQCPYMNENMQDMRAGSSRVRIVGRVGLNEDDKYVVRCAATINGQPVSTEYTDGGNTIFYPYRFAEKKTIETMKESQATQVDINVDLTPPHRTNDQKVQCYSYDVDDNFDEDRNINSLKSSNSPLVIISVYPKQERSPFADNTKRDSISPNRSSIQNNRPFQEQRSKDIVLNTNYAINTDFQLTRQTSPEFLNRQNCEICEAHKNENIENIKTAIIKTFNKSRSSSPTNKSPKHTIQKRKKQTETTVATNTRNQSPKRVNHIDNTQQKETTTTKQNYRNTVSNKTEIKKTRNANSTKFQSKSDDKSVNTDRALKNYTVAEIYTEKSNKTKNKNKNKKRNIANKKDVRTNSPHSSKQDPTVNRKRFPVNDISKVSVNIDNKKESYDVVLEKGKFGTDVTVRATNKEQSSQKYFEDTFDETFEPNLEHNLISDSLENFFPMHAVERHRRSASQAFNSDAGAFPISEHNTSRLNVRDSLEISHRRDGKDLKAHAPKRLFEYDRDDDLDRITAPKHFPGDDCIISDPVERDKEIRRLLGINKRRTVNKDVDQIQLKSGHLFSSHCLFHSALREPLIRALMLRKSCSCPSCAKKMAKLSQPKYVNNSKQPEVHFTGNREKQQILVYSVPKIEKQVYKECGNFSNRTSRTMSQLTKHESPVESSDSTSSIQNDSSQELNLQPCSRRKPIYLSIKQYKKVKRSIHKVSGKRHTLNANGVSVGDIKAKIRSEYLMHWHKEVQTDSLPIEKHKCVNTLKHKIPKKNLEKETVTLFTRDLKVNVKKKNSEVRKIASSVEIRYSSVTYLDDAAYSFANNESHGTSNLQRKKHDSIETIFKGHKKTHTPNLGTSALSLLSEDEKLLSKSETSESKPRKPFLKRLMSCLVMRSGRTSAARLAPGKQPPTVYSSDDSYQVSTSLGAIEMGSSLYDTSASFFSNHTIGPINNKMKRGFFSSVRGFLTARKA